METRLSTAEEGRRMELYRQKMSDGQAAKELGITLAAFRRWRMSRGLPLHRDTRALSPEQVAERKRVLREAPTLKAAAEQLGITPVALRNWRNSNQIEPSIPKNAPVEVTLDARTLPKEERKLYSVYKKTATDDEAANQAGITAYQWRKWRERHGLPPRRKTLQAEENERRRELYKTHMDDHKVAKILGISVAGAVEWRHTHMPELNLSIALKDEEHERRRAAYAVAANDGEAADALGITRNQMSSWRIMHKLPGRQKYIFHSEVRNRVKAYLESDDDIGAALVLGAHALQRFEKFDSFKAAAKANRWDASKSKKVEAAYLSWRKTRLGKNKAQARREFMFHLALRPSTFTSWRLSHNLPPRSQLDDDLKARLEAYVTKWSDAESSALLYKRPNAAAFARWRNKHDLPPLDPLLEPLGI